jgi:hypothetical protein
LGNTKDRARPGVFFLQGNGGVRLSRNRAETKALDRAGNLNAFPINLTIGKYLGYNKPAAFGGYVALHSF